MSVGLSIRSLLYVPGDKSNMIKKAFSLDCDGIIFDLEDAVSISQKNLARVLLIEQLTNNSWNQKTVLIRINDYLTDFYAEDIVAVGKIIPHGVIVPKSNEAAVKKTCDELSQIESKRQIKANTIKLIPLVETAYGIENISSIITASPRVYAVQFGAEDLTRDLGITRTKTGEEVLYAKNRMVIACKAAGVEPIDTPYTDFNDETGLLNEINISKGMGMTAKTCIHPKQIVPVNQAFSPTLEEIALAERIIAVSEEPDNIHSGAFALDGKMIDAPIIARARKTLETAKLKV
jgi:citrate lyase subunit beta/citryl-CoA lyase